MADLSASLLLALVGRSARQGRGTLRLEGPAIPGGRPVASGSGEPRVSVTVHDARAWAAVVRHGSTGLAAGYREGWWDCDDLTGLVRIALLRSQGLRQRLDAAARRANWPLAAAKRLRPRTARQDRDHVAAHYDLSNDFFALMLDPTMTYSCAYFSNPDMTLEEAQLAKYSRMASRLGLAPHDHVIEIGTGWGGFAIYLAEQIGCRVTTTTLSEAQRTLALRRVAKRKLDDRVTVLGSDWRELDGTYDALVSIEMVEAVDWRLHDAFFAACARLLNERGRIGLQAITIADGSFERAKLHNDFIKAMVFPGGCLPSLASMTASVARTSDLRVVELEDIGPHYAETLRRWRRNLAEHDEQVRRLGFDERFRRVWDLYLCYCEAAFTERHVSDVQLVLARPGTPPRSSPRSRP